VYKLDERRALVQTVDFFTPIVDDPETYGRIAAANSLSDVYAMGGRPLTALAIASFPKDAPGQILAAIFRGGLATLHESGVALLGGHTVQDAEIKFGYAVTGEVDPAHIWSNAGARPGDRLILTKSIGTGVIATAIKFDRAPREAADAAIASMIHPNRDAADALRTLGPAVHACTDITGFGLIGHASEMARASGCSLEFEAGAVPLLPGAVELVEKNTPGGGRTNQQYFGVSVTASSALDPRVVQLLYDPQTSGGLLAAVDGAAADAALDALAARGVRGHLVGHVLSPAQGGPNSPQMVAVSLR
jgi:selenide,water dikinase